MEATTAQTTRALAFCVRRGIKITQREDSFWVILDQEFTPFYWAVFTTSYHAALAYEAYRENLDDAYNDGTQST